MMPFVPFVRCRDIDHAISLAQKYEHGYRHTSMIHSRNVRNMTKMARAMDTNAVRKNGPCMAALGLGGEGYLSFSIAGPTGEGVTTPLTFTRERRCSLIEDLYVLGAQPPSEVKPMQAALVIGHGTSTVKHSTLDNLKLLVVQPLMADGRAPDGPPLLAVDRMGAGLHETVMLTSDGSAIRDMFQVENAPIRWAVLGVIDPS